jgi:multiple sugar transport system substrate-binding protein
VTRVHFLGPDTDAYVASVERHASEFEETTGLGLDVTIIESDLYFSNKIHHLLDGEDAADVYMSGPVLVWEHLDAGFVRPLDDLVEDTSDFFDSLLACNRWSGRFGDPLGAGPLLEVPVNCESYNLAYVPAVLEQAGVEVPGTWDAYLDAARSVRFAQRGTDAWHTMYTGFATQLWSCGGSDFENGRCAIASPVAVQVTEAFLAALHDAGPENWPEQRWYELALDFGQGKYGLIVDSDHYVAYFEDPAVSPLHGQIAYAPPPAGPAGRRSNLWTWSLVVNPRARDVDAIRQFVGWASSREFLLRSAFEGNMNPTRRSIWDDERFRAHAAGWGAFYDVARNLIERDASVLVTPAANYLAIASRWVAALLAAYSSGDVRGELEQAAADIERLL